MSRRSTTGREPGGEQVGPGLDRRRFCRLTALLGGCAFGSLLVPRVGSPIGPGRPDFQGADTLYRGIYPLDEPGSVVLSTCLACHAACPVRISREVGVVAKSDGNPWSPRVSGGPWPTDAEHAAGLRGASCARGQARLQNTHDPYRLVRPLGRDAERGAGAWRSLQPGEARAWLAPVVERGQSSDLFVAADPRQLDRKPVLAAFKRTFGRIQVHLGSPIPWVFEASGAMLGQSGWAILPRMERGRGALIWGADAVASGVDPVADTRELMRIRARRGEGVLVVVDPRLSEIAGLADVWLPVRPGGDMALAWMMLRAWADAGVYEPPGEWANQLAAQPWKDLERRSGLGEMVVRRTAEQLSELGEGLVIRIGGGVGEQKEGAEICEAILRLAVLSGATGSGGAMEPVAAPQRLGGRPDQALRRRLENERPIDVLIVVGDGGIVDGPHQGQLLGALADPERVRHLVVVTSTMNPVAALADLVVPDVTEHERSGLVERWDGTSLVQPVVPSVMTAVGLQPPWDRGLEGLLETLCELTGRSLDCKAVVADAVAATGSAEELTLRGWVPATSASNPPTVPTAFRETAMRSPGRPVGGLALVTFREAFGGFVDSTAQYWATPSLRGENSAWIHPSTVAELGVDRHLRVRLEAGGAHLETPVLPTEGVRPGVVAIAIGYGHGEGFNGEMTIDGVPVQADPRRTLGVDVGALRGDSGAVAASPAEPEGRTTLAELLASGTGSCDRL